MRANKIFFDLYSTPPMGVGYEAYRKLYEANRDVYIALMDAGIYTKVDRNELFDKGMYYGCILEHKCYDTPKQVKEVALRFAEAHGLRYVEPDEFIELEKAKQDERVAKAFALAEAMIRSN